MSDLKHQSKEQLEVSQRGCERYIKYLGSKLAGQKERLKWIKRYLSEK